jgi:hypothetical protein
VVDNKFAKRVEYKMENQTQTTMELSPRTKEILQRNRKSKQRDSKFVKIQPRERRMLTNSVILQNPKKANISHRRCSSLIVVNYRNETPSLRLLIF